MNQPCLRNEVITKYLLVQDFEEITDCVLSRGRRETRTIKTFDFSSKQWPEVQKGARLFRHTTRKQNKKLKETRNPSYYLCNKNLSPKQFNSAIRKHWSIENTNHYIRDNVLLEDKSRIRIKATNMMVIRSFAYNIIQANKGQRAFSTQIEMNKLSFDKLFEFSGVAMK